jgi:AcrR family transcriptional regulator
MTTVINNRGRGRPRAFDRDQALQQAMETFWANGYNATSVPMLTEAMGISAQSLYAAFGSKDALYREAIALYQSTVGGFGARAMAEENDAIAAMARLFRDAASAFTSSPTHPGCMITTAPSGQGDEPLTIFGRQLRAEAMRQVRKRLERGVREGQLRADTDCDAWARYVVGVTQGLSTQALDGETLEGLLTTAAIAARSLEELRR